MGMHLSLNLKGLEDYIEKIQKVGGNVDNAVEEALNEGADFLLDEMRQGVERHIDQGRAFKAVKRRQVERSGTTLSVEVGALDIRREDQDGFHVVYQEYGSPGKMKADPWLAPALSKKPQAIKIMKDVLKKAGVPIE